MNKLKHIGLWIIAIVLFIWYAIFPEEGDPNPESWDTNN